MILHHEEDEDVRARLSELGLVFAIALAVRAAWGIYRIRMGQGATLEFPDESQYWFIAQSLSQGNGLVDDMGFRATRMPLYPAFLSIFAGLPGGITWAKCAQWIIGALAAPAVLAIGCRVASRRQALLGGIVVAIDPFLVFFSSLLLTETAGITALCLFWMLVVPLCRDFRRSSWDYWLLTGLAAAVCVYLREANLGLVVVTIAAVFAFRRFEIRVLRGGMLALAIVAVCLFPWAMRNKRVLGEWRWLTTRGGISLYDGVGPQATGASDLALIQRTGEAADLNETQWDSYFSRKSKEALTQDPQRVLRLAGAKLKRLWNPFPNVETYRGGYTVWAAALWTVFIFVFAAIGAAKLMMTGRAGIAVFCLLPAVYFSLLHSVYVGSVRYRLPAMPMIAVLAAMALTGPKRETSDV